VVSRRGKRKEGARESLVMASFKQRIISYEQLQTELNRLKLYTSLQLRIISKNTTPTAAGNNNRQGSSSRYVLVDEKNMEVSGIMTKLEIYQQLNAANQIFHLFHTQKLRQQQQQ
jgi:hypothetical protein